MAKEASLFHRTRPGLRPQPLGADHVAVRVLILGVGLFVLALVALLVLG